MISIVIPTLNEERYLPQLLKCITNQSYKDFELIISDAGSKDNTLNIAKEFGGKIVKGGIPGIGRNNGAKESQGEIIVFIDSDVTFENDFFEKILKEFKSKNLDMAVPYFHTNSDKLKFSIFFRNANLFKRIMQFTRFPDGTGQFLIVKKIVFEKLGGFKDYDVAEDTELSWRAARSKFKVGTLNSRFYSSTRRLEKMGVFWTLAFWGLLGVFMIFGIIHRKDVQNFALKLYGGWNTLKLKPN